MMEIEVEIYASVLDPKSLANAWRFNSQPCTTRTIRPISELLSDFLKFVRFILIDKRFQTLLDLSI